MEHKLEVTRQQLQSVENSVISRESAVSDSPAGAESMTYELKRELVQSQVALADCRNEKEEVLNELRRLHEEFAACQNADYTRVG